MLPIVLYTGEQNWKKIATLVDLVAAGALFDDVIPAFKPRFLNLRDTSAETLVREGGFFGQVLRLIHDHHAEPAVFRQTLEEVITYLEAMPDAERNRWVELLSYIAATANMQELETWLDNFANAETLADVGVPVD